MRTSVCVTNILVLVTLLHIQAEAELTTCPRGCDDCAGHSVGDRWQGQIQGECLNVFCHKEATHSIQVSLQACGYLVIPSGCSFTPENATLPYPQCCANAVCP